MLRQQILFQKPRHKTLIQQGFTPVDMHNHSQYSDTTTKLPTIAKKARKLGIGVALTDHNEVAGNIRLAKENPDLLVVPGLEITTKEMAHVLTYFYSHDEMQDFFRKHIKDSRGGNPNLATNVSVTDLVDITKDYSCLVAPAHPFAFPKRFSFISAMERGFVDKSVLQSLHAVEVICGANLRYMNNCAVDWAAELEKGTIGGSDSHSIGTLGTVVTLTEGSTPEEILNSIKRKQTTVMGTEAKLYQRPMPLAKIASCHLRYWKPTMKTQYELNVRRPMLTTGKMLVKRLGPEKRREQRFGLVRGIENLSEELEWKGYPRIEKPIFMKRVSGLLRR